MSRDVQPTLPEQDTKSRSGQALTPSLPPAVWTYCVLWTGLGPRRGATGHTSDKDTQNWARAITRIPPFPIYTVGVVGRNLSRDFTEFTDGKAS